MSMEVRQVRNEADGRSASYIHAMGWKDGFRGILSQKLLDEISLYGRAEMFMEAYGDPSRSIVLLNVDGTDLGAGSFGFSRHHKDKTYGEIISFYVLKVAWGSGCAQVLMAYMVRTLREMGCEHIHLWVLKENPRARRFYEKCGFRPSGQEMLLDIQGEKHTEVEYVYVDTAGADCD